MEIWKLLIVNMLDNFANKVMKIVVPKALKVELYQQLQRTYWFMDITNLCSQDFT